MAIRMVLSMPERRLRDLRPWEASPGYRMIGAVAATMENEGNPSVVHPGLGAVAVATPPGRGRIVVPVDGSPFAERALPVATWVARALETPIHLVEVVARPAGTEPAIHYLDGLARRSAAPSWDVAPGDDPAGAIIAATDADPPSIVCLATHGRDRSATILGSVATRLLDRTTRPVMLVGPEARPPCAGDSPVVVAVDGVDEADDAALVRVALAWATALATGVVPGGSAAAPGPRAGRPGGVRGGPPSRGRPGGHRRYHPGHLRPHQRAGRAGAARRSDRGPAGHGGAPPDPAVARALRQPRRPGRPRRRRAGAGRPARPRVKEQGVDNWTKEQTRWPFASASTVSGASGASSCGPPSSRALISTSLPPTMSGPSRRWRTCSSTTRSWARCRTRSKPRTAA